MSLGEREVAEVDMVDKNKGQRVRNTNGGVNAAISKAGFPNSSVVVPPSHTTHRHKREC